MSVTKILCTRKILGSIASTLSGPDSVRQHMSKAYIKPFQRPSATDRLVHASRAVAPSQEDIEEAEVPVKQQLMSLPHKRSEMDQRRIVRARSLETLKKMHNQKKPEKVNRMPFVRDSYPAIGTLSRYRRYSDVDTLLKCTSEPNKLAQELVDLAHELQLEKDKNKRLMDNYQDLLGQLTLKESK